MFRIAKKTETQQKIINKTYGVSHWRPRKNQGRKHKNPRKSDSPELVVAVKERLWILEKSQSCLTSDTGKAAWKKKHPDSDTQLFDIFLTYRVIHPSWPTLAFSETTAPDSRASLEPGNELLRLGDFRFLTTQTNNSCPSRHHNRPWCWFGWRSYLFPRKTKT